MSEPDYSELEHYGSLRGLTLDERLEIHRYQAFRLCRWLRDQVNNREGKKFLTRVMKHLKEAV